MALSQAYEKPVEDVFDDFDYEPHGSASLAQVHYACLKTGESVAVKVQRLYAREESMLNDTSAMESLVVRFSKIKLVKTLIRVFKQVTLEETDFLHEAENILEYRKNVENILYCQAAQVYLDYCTPKVLVMERIDGPHIGDLHALREEDYDLADIAVKDTYNMMKQITVRQVMFATLKLRFFSSLIQQGIDHTLKRDRCLVIYGLILQPQDLKSIWISQNIQGVSSL